MRVMRSLYSTRQEGERVVCPLELKAGVVDGRWTPLAKEQAAFAVAHLTPAESSQLFEKLGSMRPSKSTFELDPMLTTLLASLSGMVVLSIDGVVTNR